MKRVGIFFRIWEGGSTTKHKSFSLDLFASPMQKRKNEKKERVSLKKVIKKGFLKTGFNNWNSFKKLAPISYDLICCLLFSRLIVSDCS